MTEWQDAQELLREREAHWTKLYDAQRMSDAAFYSEIIQRREAEVAQLVQALIQERANNIRLQKRAEDCGAPHHVYPAGQPRIDRSVNEEVLAERQIRAVLTRKVVT